MKIKPRNMLLLLAAVCGLPIVFSYLAFYVWKPQTTMNYGELITPAPLAGSLTDLEGRPVGLETLRGKWVMLYASSAQCDETCKQLLYYMRQARTAQGEHMDRIERVWVITDSATPDAAWLKDYPGMKLLRGTPSLPAPQSASRHIYLLDPLGNVFMRYPDNPEPKRIIKDLSRLMKFSNVDRGAK
ncbi:MAG: hypothetical protein RIR70_133 [Pseudomonadota bacterium]|jgi:cytochrome oxidase Cu insertion factor (SCO1/SenC/PrrC family)